MAFLTLINKGKIEYTGDIFLPISLLLFLSKASLNSRRKLTALVHKDSFALSDRQKDKE
jgi:hypothetical protein